MVPYKFIILLLVFLLPINAYAALDWDLINEDCADISDWADLDSNTGASTQATFDSKSTFKFNAPLHVGVSYNDAVRSYNTAAIGTSFTVEVSFYISSASTGAEAILQIRDNDGAGGGEPYGYEVGIGTSYLGIWNVAGDDTIFVDASISVDTWHVLRVVVDNRYQSVWLDDRLYISGIQNNHVSTGFTPNIAFIILRSSTTANKETYFDYFKIDSSKEHLTTSPLTINSEKIVVRYRQDTDAADYINGQEKLRLYGSIIAGGSDEILSIPLVATGDDNASKVRIYDGSATKSLMKLPE